MSATPEVEQVVRQVSEVVRKAMSPRDERFRRLNRKVNDQGREIRNLKTRVNQLDQDIQTLYQRQVTADC